jgi:hypothetical protein
VRWSAAKSKRLRPPPKPPIRPAAAVAEDFVTALGRGLRPSIEAALDGANRDEWPSLLRSLLVAEIGDRRARGEAPVAREYLPRFPAHTEVVRAVLPEAPPPVVPAPAEPAATTRLPAWVREVTYPESPAVVVAPPPAVPMAVLLPAPEPVADPPGEPIPMPARSRGAGRRLGVAVGVIAVLAAGLVLVYRPKLESETANPAAAPPPPAPAAALTPAPKPPINLRAPVGDPERDLADWVLSLGGRGELQPDGGSRRPFSADSPPPKARFSVTGITIPPEAAGRWTPADLSRLAGRAKLAAVQLYGVGPLTEADLAPLAGRPLRLLELHGGPVRVTGAFCASFADLETLCLTNVPDFADADLLAVGRLPRLSSLTLNSPMLTSDGFRGLKNPLLKSLAFGDLVALTPDHVRMLQRPGIEAFEATGLTDDAFVEFALIPDLKRVRLRRTALTDAGLKAVAALGKLEELAVDGSSITGPGLEQLTERKALKILDLSGGKLSNESLTPLLGLPSLRQLRLAGNPITDEGAFLLANLERVELLDLGETGITDESLRHLAKHTTLKNLIVTNTKVTAPAVREFEAATPGCKVDFGRRR